MQYLRLPFFDAVADAKTILLAGCGGGYDVFTGLPLYFGLCAAGKAVHLANLSFSQLPHSAAAKIAPGLFKVEAGMRSRNPYFPELHLSRWFAARGKETPIYCFESMGVVGLTDAYKALLDEVQPDAIVLVDGGTDSLMRGDEAGLGTPHEDIASIVAVSLLDVPIKLLTCIGFGVDTHHEVCHAQFLDAVTRRILYLKDMLWTRTHGDISQVILNYRATHKIKSWQNLPM